MNKNQTRFECMKLSDNNFISFIFFDEINSFFQNRFSSPLNTCDLLIVFLCFIDINTSKHSGELLN